MDYNKMINDVVDAQASDKHRQLVNDAKFRAVEQRVASYNEFAAIVQGCHLRPLDKKESVAALARSTSGWNSMASKTARSSYMLDDEVSKYFSSGPKAARIASQNQMTLQENSSCPNELNKTAEHQ